jgi:ribosomal protein L40E
MVSMSSLSCRFCSQRNPPGAKFCIDCGSPLALKPCPKCEAITDGGAERCHQCGAPFFDADAISDPSRGVASPGQRAAGVAEHLAAGGLTREHMHIPESLADRLDGSGMPHSNDEAASSEVATSIAGYAGGAEPHHAFVARGNRAVATRRRGFRPAALAAALIAISVAGYFAYVNRMPELRRGGDVALVGDGPTKAVPADSMREATAIDGSAKGTPAEPRAVNPVVRSPAPVESEPAKSQPEKSQPESVTPQPLPAQSESQPAASQPDPVKSRVEPARRARKAPDASALATQRLIARDLGRFAEAPRSPSPSPDRDAIETQRLIERDLGPFLHRNASGATGGALPAIN